MSIDGKVGGMTVSNDYMQKKKNASLWFQLQSTTGKLYINPYSEGKIAHNVHPEEKQLMAFERSSFIPCDSTIVAEFMQN